MNKLNLIIVVACSLLFIGCGGGGDSGGSAGQSTPSSSTNSGSNTDDGSSNSGNNDTGSAQEVGFAELEVDMGFDWQMIEQADLSFELVSLISQGQSRAIGSSSRSQSGWLSISGRYVVSVFAIDGDGNVLTNAIFTGMTNQYGQLAVNFTLMDEWLGVVVDVDLDGQGDGQSCSQSIYRNELDEPVQLGCDIAVGSDL